jgi:rod shape-determining protein MreD
MNPIITRNAGRFVILLFLQVLVISHLQMSSLVTPFIYVLAILLLPINTPRWLLLVVAFVYGFFLDIFAGTMGLNMSAALVMAFIRPLLLEMITFGREFDETDAPSLRTLGLDWFLAYASVMIVIHHATFFLLETSSALTTVTIFCNCLSTCS